MQSIILATGIVLISGTVTYDVMKSRHFARQNKITLNQDK